MDQAVALVQSYLRINGFLTVTEYPIIHSRQSDSFQEVTDVDVLAIRMPFAGRVLPRPFTTDSSKFANDPALDLEWGRQELLIAEVKEGEASLNSAMFRRSVLRESIRRFGICSRQELSTAVKALASHGIALLENGSRIRLVAFGSKPPERPGPFTFIPLAAVASYVRQYIDAHWRIQSNAPFRDDVLRFMAVLAKADRQPF